MAIIGQLYKGIANFDERVRLRVQKDAGESQEATLRRLLSMAEHTDFGRHHDFSSILLSSDPIHAYQQAVPIVDYNTMYDAWWHRTVAGERNVTWPGKIRYFALSSGTSGSASKQIPVSSEMLMAMRRASLRHFFCVRHHNLPSSLYTKDVLMLGGSTHLNRFDGRKLQGDLSGILARRIPAWLQYQYKPGRSLSRLRDWETKLQRITEMAPEWDIGVIAGVPAWAMILLQRVIDAHGLSNIHEIWPNFQVYIHGGVSFEPYRESFKNLLGSHVYCMETYLASEGYIAYETRSGKRSLKLVLNNGIFFEFVPFNERNFNLDGTIKSAAQAVALDAVEEGEEYAVLLSTCAGAWRYLLGDTVRIVDRDKSEVVITGRTKHFLSLCGEHLSVDNMNMGVMKAARKLNFNCMEFTVHGVPQDNLFAHEWYIGSDRPIDTAQVKAALDSELCALNDDYATERQHALGMHVKVVPNDLFYNWMEQKGKQGGQHKFPRVLSADQAADWQRLLNQQPTLWDS